MPRKRQFRVFGSGRETDGAVVIDEVTPTLALLQTNFPKATDRAVRHVAFETHKAVKNYMRGDRHSIPLREVTKTRAVDRLKRSNIGRRLRQKKYAGDVSEAGRGLEKAVNFEHKKGKAIALTGWGSNDSSRVSGPRFQQGSTTIVTQKMKNMFFAMARKSRGVRRRVLFGLAGKAVGSVIRNPGRPVFDPVYMRMLPVFPRLMEARIERNIGLITNEAYTAIINDALGADRNLRTAKKQKVG
jgi:hypothetical protein